MQPLFTVVVHAVETRVPAAQTVQAVQAAAFVVVLYVDPAMQDVQTLLTVTEHGVEAYLPAVHTVQAVQLAAFVVVL